MLRFLADPASYNDLSFLKEVEDGRPITKNTLISVRKIADGFAGFGF